MVRKNISFSRFFLIFILIGSCWARGSDVVELTDDNFDTLTEEGVWFIGIFVSWCSHCRKVEGIWEELASKLKEEGIQVGRIDGTRQHVLVARFELTAYPAFYHLANGECREYEGQRSVSEFFEFATEGWEKVDPLPFYKAPNSPVGRLMGIVKRVPNFLHQNYRWMHTEKGLSELSILAITLSIPVSIGLGLICLLDFFNTRRNEERAGHQHLHID